MSEGNKNVGRTGNTKIIIIVLLCVLIAAVAALVIVLLRDDGPQPPERVHIAAGGGRGTVATPENIEEIREAAGRPVTDGHYHAHMTTEWTFPNTRAPSPDAWVENAPDNTRTVYFDLILRETGELIYSSPFIPVGARHYGFALTADVPAGEHSAVVTYHLVDDDYQEITTVSIAVTLRVLE